MIVETNPRRAQYLGLGSKQQSAVGYVGCANGCSMESQRNGSNLRSVAGASVSGRIGDNEMTRQ